MTTATETETEPSPHPAAKTSGITAAWHLTIVTGKEAQALLEMQNQAIISILTWTAVHGNGVIQNADDSPGTRSDDSRETFELAA